MNCSKKTHGSRGVRCYFLPSHEINSVFLSETSFFKENCKQTCTVCKILRVSSLQLSLAWLACPKWINCSKKTHCSRGVKEVHKVCEAHDEPVGFIYRAFFCLMNYKWFFITIDLNWPGCGWDMNIFLQHHHTFRNTERPRATPL